MMKNRPTSLGVTSGSSRPGSEKNRRLAAKMESSEHVQAAIQQDRRRGLENRLGWNNNRKRPHFQNQAPNPTKGNKPLPQTKKEKKEASKKEKGYGARVQLSQEELDRELDSYVKKRKEIAQAKTKSESDSKESGNGVAEPEPSEPKDPLAEPKDPLAEQAEPAKEDLPDENPEPKEPVSATV